MAGDRNVIGQFSIYEVEYSLPEFEAVSFFQIFCFTWLIVINFCWQVEVFKKLLSSVDFV